MGAGARTSYLARPLTLQVPSPAPSGYSTVVVEGVLITEFLAGLGFKNGWDLGIGFGAHVYQWGPGKRALTGEPDRLTSFAATDPRFEIGWASPKATFYYRPFAAIHLPLGNPEAFSGEKSPRIEAGMTASSNSDWIEWAAQAALRYRAPIDFSAITWGSQLHLAGGVMVHLSPAFVLGPEIHWLPVLNSQRTPEGENGGRVMPAEALATLRYRAETWDYCRFGRKRTASQSNLKCKR